MLGYILIVQMWWSGIAGLPCYQVHPWYPGLDHPEFRLFAYHVTPHICFAWKWSPHRDYWWGYMIELPGPPL